MNGFWAAVLIAAVLGAFTWFAYGASAWPVYLVLAVGLGVANTGRKNFWHLPRAQEDVATWDHSKAARLRRRKLNLSIEVIKHRIPFARLEAAMAILWLMINFSTFFTLWVLALLEGAMNPWHALDVFIVYLTFSATYVGVTRLHSWASSRWPETQRVHLWGAPMFVCDGHVPGQHVISVDLPTTGDPGPDGKAPTRTVYAEVILCKYVKSLPKWLHARPVLVIADASLPGRRAGYNKGLVYEIDCRPDPYIAGDMYYWRMDVWLTKARELLGNAEVPDNTIVLLAMERTTPEKGELSALPPVLVREMYALRARNLQVETDLDDYTMSDKSREAMQ